MTGKRLRALAKVATMLPYDWCKLMRMADASSASRATSIRARAGILWHQMTHEEQLTAQSMLARSRNRLKKSLKKAERR